MPRRLLEEVLDFPHGLFSMAVGLRVVKDLKDMFWACPQCEHYRVSKPRNTFLQTLDATYPWEHISSDLAQHDGKHYLVVVDRYLLQMARDGTTATVSGHEGGHRPVQKTFPNPRDT